MKSTISICTTLLFLIIILPNLLSQNQDAQIRLEEITNEDFQAYYATVLKAKRSNDPTTAEKYRTLIKMSIKVDSVELVANTFVEYSIYLSNRGILDTALLFAFKAQEMTFDLKNEFLDARIAHALGWYYHNLGDYDAALENYFNSLSFFEAIPFQRGIDNTLRKIALSYGKLGKHKEALRIHDRIYQNEDCEDCPAIIASRLFKTYMAKDTQRTLRYIDLYHNSIENAEDHEKFNYAWHEIKGIEAEYENDQQRELYHLERAKQIIEDDNKPKVKARIYDNLGDFHNRHKNFDSAKEYYEKSYQIIQEYGFKSSFIEIVKKLITSAESQNDDKALELYQNELKQFNSELNNKKALGSVLNQRHKLKIKEKESEIDTLKSARKSQKKFVYLLSIFSGIAIILMFISIYYYLKHRSLSRNLEEKNQALDLSIKEKQTLLQETHHRVKNNLQIIASLLNLQRKYTKDKKLTSALIDGRNRVKSMALIHQLLYQNKVIKGINVRSYVESLMSSLLGSFKVDEDKIKFINDVEPLDLHEDSLLSIGLIINELVTNSLKYAFAEEGEGNIKVTLKAVENHLILGVIDDGIGITDEIDIKNSNSFGYNLVNSLCKKLGASMIINTDEGTSVMFEITKFKMAS